MPSIQPSEVHIFCSADLADVYKDSVREGGYHLHEIDNLVEFGIQLAQLGRTENVVLLMKDGDLSMHKYGRAAQNTKMMRQLGRMSTRDESVAHDAALLNSALKILGSDPAKLVDGTSGANPDFATLEELKSFSEEHFDHALLTSGPHVIASLRETFGDNHPVIVVMGVDHEEAEPYEKLSERGQVTTITADDSLAADRRMEREPDARTKLMDRAFSRVLHAEIVRPSVGTSAQDVIGGHGNPEFQDR